MIRRLGLQIMGGDFCMRIEICGGIATGKTTLTKQLSCLGLTAVFEDFSSIAFLSDFYKTPDLYAYETEIAFLLQHVFQIKKSAILNNQIVCDYSIEQDFAYALNNLLPHEMESFEQIYRISKSKLEPTTLIICLQANPTTLKERIKKRGHTNEKDISIDYLCSTCAQVENQVKSITTPVVFFNTDKLNFLDLKVVEKNVLPIINAYMKAK